MESLLDRALGLEDLYATPEDGNRYEILDGALVMSPPPGSAHQIVAAELAALLREGRSLEGFAPCLLLCPSASDRVRCPSPT